MSEQGWWKLDTGDFPMEDADREHVAAAITHGVTQGELFHEEGPEAEVELLADRKPFDDFHTSA